MPEERSSILQLVYAAAVTAHVASRFSKDLPAPQPSARKLPYYKKLRHTRAAPTALQQLHCPREGAKADRTQERRLREGAKQDRIQEKDDHARRHDLTKKSNTALG